MSGGGRRRSLAITGAAIGLVAGLASGASAQAPAPQAPREPTHADILRGAYGPYRANNDLLSYRLDIRIDPEKKYISGTNTIRFKMLKDDTRIQIDLFANLNVDKILLNGAPLKYERDGNAVFIDFATPLTQGRVYAVDFHYSGNPLETGRFGCMTFKKDPAGRPWVNTACEEVGASVWWPNKDQWRDEVEEAWISVAVPDSLVDVSNGKFLGKTALGDGYTRWDWHVQYPINSYCVSVNIGAYAHWSETLGDLPLDFYALPENVDKAKKQFAQAAPMIGVFQSYFGEYPFKKDGYKLIEVPYSGMEHQSAVTYGNHFANGYLERDWTGVGISLRFDFIIIHESAHEWMGNAISAADTSDMWIHEGWATYLECLYVEKMYGYADGQKYTNAYKTKVRNREPIVTARGVNRTPPQDMYFKGALFLNTLRSLVDNDSRWWAMLRAYFQTFKYKNIMTEDVVAFFNKQTGRDLTPIFNQYLRHADLPTLELQFHPADKTVAYRWRADESGFAMPIKAGDKDHWQLITPTSSWQTMNTTLTRETFAVATDLYYVNVSTSTPGPDPDPKRFAAEIRAFQDLDARNAPPAHAVLFAGSSSIRLWPTAARFPTLPVINRGFGGSHISDVLVYIRETVLKYEPDIVVFYAGDNDIGEGKPPERVLADYRTFAETVFAAKPSTVIVFIAIKPSLARWALWPQMQRANALVQAYSTTRPNLRFVDIAPPMLGPDGTPKKELFVADGLHLTPAGYDIWTDLVGRAIAAIRNPR